MCFVQNIFLLLQSMCAHRGSDCVFFAVTLKRMMTFFLLFVLLFSLIYVRDTNIISPLVLLSYYIADDTDDNDNDDDLSIGCFDIMLMLMHHNLANDKYYKILFCCLIVSYDMPAKSCLLLLLLLFCRFEFFNASATTFFMLPKAKDLCFSSLHSYHRQLHVSEMNRRRKNNSRTSDYRIR